jgi:hypothetical protein
MKITDKATRKIRYMYEPFLDGCMLTPALRIRQALLRKNRIQRTALLVRDQDKGPKSWAIMALSV